LTKRLLIVALLLLVALPLSASQFIRQPFDKVVRDSVVVVRGTVGPVQASWNDSHEVIFSRTFVQVDEFLAGNGPSLIPLREAGGTVDGYTQDAIGFPALREGERVILFLTKWDDGADDYRIAAYGQGKWLVRVARDGSEFVTPDPAEQGVEHQPSRIRAMQESATEGTAMDEFVSMIDAAARGARAARNQQ
jgi:hypothetical protein